MIVLVGFGVIDILFKQIALTTTFSFTVLVCRFAISLVVMILVVIYDG
jgi:hypothetical protein